MFTGIIKSTSQITDYQQSPAGDLVEVGKPKDWKVKPGDSIAVDGICSTVKQADQTLIFEYMPETVKRTTVADWQVGDVVNLEQSLKLSDLVDGHFVQGHVDSPGKVISLRPEGNSVVMRVEPADRSSLHLVAEKGSIALDGVSLTVTAVDNEIFEVKLIPYTQEHTNLGTKKIGQRVNIEFDMLAKYLARLVKKEV